MPNECMPVKSLLKASDIYYECLWNWYVQKGDEKLPQ